MAKQESRSAEKSAKADLKPEEASRLVKKWAAKQKVRIRLTDAQMGAILDQWKGLNPRMPAEITFYAGRRAVANLKVASYWYRGDTCCV